MNKIIKALAKLKNDINADCESRQLYRKKYHKNKPTEQRLPLMLVKNIGVQSMAAIRLMQFGADSEIPFAGEVASRLIRYVYGMETHWNAKIDPGVSIVHGVGLVISHAAHVKSGCILSQNVTLGEGRDSKTKQMGAPTLENNVHVGPGAKIIGPVNIGANSKIMAGAVVTTSIPPNSLVKAPKPKVIQRQSDTTAQN